MWIKKNILYQESLRNVRDKNKNINSPLLNYFADQKKKLNNTNDVKIVYINKIASKNIQRKT